MHSSNYNNSIKINLKRSGNPIERLTTKLHRQSTRTKSVCTVKYVFERIPTHEDILCNVKKINNLHYKLVSM